MTFDDVEFDADENPIDYMIMGDINVDATDGTKYVVTQIDLTNVETADDNLSDVLETVSGTDQTEIEVEGAVMTMEVSAPSPAEANSDRDDVLVAEIELDAEDSGDNFNITEVNLDIVVGIGEITTITVTAAATAPGNATIELDGAGPANVAVTATTINANAAEIALEVDAISGYSASSAGAVVTIVSESAENDTLTVFNVVVADLAVTVASVDGDAASTARLAEITNCDLYDGDDRVSTSDEDASALMNFSADVDVAKDSLKTLELRCDISSTVTNADVITVGGVTNSFDADAEVTDVDYSDQAGTGSSIVTVKSGTLTAVVSSDDKNDAKVVKESTNNIVLGILEVEGDNADVTIDTLTATMSGITNFEGKVGLYVNDSLVEDVTVAASMVFTGLSIEVDNGEKVDIEFRVDAEDTAPSAVAETLTVTTITLEEAGTTGVSGASIALAPVTVVNGVPVITQMDESSDSLETEDDVVLFAIQIAAEGEDVTLDGVNLDVTYSNATLVDASIEVYDNADRNGTAEFQGTIAAGVPATFTEAGMSTVISDGGSY